MYWQRRQQFPPKKEQEQRLNTTTTTIPFMEWMKIIYNFSIINNNTGIIEIKVPESKAKNGVLFNSNYKSNTILRQR